jgi:putative ABC transport system permease protein
MVFLLRGISWPYFKRHWVISALTASGVALGVGVYIAIELSAASLKVSMRQTVDRVAGKTQLEVTAGEAGFPEAALEMVRATPGVAAAQPVVEAVVRAEGEAESSVMVLGIDFLGDRTLRDWDYEDEEVLDDPLIFLAQPDSICLTEEFAARHNLVLEDTVSLETGHGWKPFTVRGLIRPEGPATAFGGNIALMDLYAAQYTFSRGRRLDRIDVLLEDGVSLEEAMSDLRAALGTGYTVDTPARRGAQMEVLIENFGATMSLSCWQAIFIAVFMIFNVFAVAVARRRREIGILRSLGVTRRKIMGLFLVEGAIIGCIGTAFGLALGLLMASGVTRFMIALTEVAYGTTHSAPHLVIEVRVLLLGMLLGVTSAVAAAFFPARGAAMLRPVEALAKGRFQRTSETQSRPRQAIGVGLAVLAVVLLFTAAKSSLLGAITTMMLINLAALFLIPSLIGPLVRLLRPVFGGLFGVEGRIAADTLTQAPRRTSATVLALMVAIAFVISLAGMASSFRRSYRLWIDGVLNADFYLTASERFFSKSFHIPPEFEQEVASVPGVRSVEPFRGVRIDLEGRRPLLASLPLALTYSRMDVPVVAGDKKEWLNRGPLGEGFAVSDNFARLFGLGVGDTLTLPSPSGPVSLPILVEVLDYSSEQGTIWVDRSVYVERWKDEGIDTLDVMLETGVRREAVAEAIRERLSGRTNRLFIMTNEEFKKIISRILDQFFSLSYIQLLIALLVAVLGIANTLVISVAERRRELGILKALGTERRQIVRLIVVEALGIVICGGILGYALGSYLIDFSVESISENMSGWSLPFAFPWGMALGLAPLLLAVTVIAALYPARVALSVSPAEALEFE